MPRKWRTSRISDSGSKKNGDKRGTVSNATKDKEEIINLKEHEKPTRGHVDYGRQNTKGPMQKHFPSEQGMDPIWGRWPTAQQQHLKQQPKKSTVMTRVSWHAPSKLVQTLDPALASASGALKPTSDDNYVKGIDNSSVNPKPILKFDEKKSLAMDLARRSSKFGESDANPIWNPTSLKDHDTPSSVAFAITSDAKKQLFNVVANVDLVWLEHTKYHVGSQPPNPYEYDVYADLKQRMLYIMPLFNKDTTNVEVKRGFGSANTSYIIPPKFACLSLSGQTMCDISWEVMENCWSGPRIQMEVSVMGITLGKVLQKHGDISILDSSDKEVLVIKDLPMPSRIFCNASARPFSCKILKLEEARDPSVIGMIGRNGPDKSAVVFGQPLGFYFQLKGKGKDSSKKVKLDEASRICLLCVIIGLMTTCESKKCEQEAVGNGSDPNEDLVNLFTMLVDIRCDTVLSGGFPRICVNSGLWYILDV